MGPIIAKEFSFLSNERRKHYIASFEFRTGLFAGWRWSLNLEVHVDFPCADSAFQPNGMTEETRPYL
jgi:hypothetical protein